MLSMFKKDGDQVQCAEEEGRTVCFFRLPIADETGKPAGEMPVMIDVAVTPLLTAEQAAKHVEISTRTLLSWRKDGLLTIDFVCGKRRSPMFPLSILQRYCQAIGHKAGMKRCGDGNYRLVERRHEKAIPSGR